MKSARLLSTVAALLVGACMLSPQTLLGQGSPSQVSVSASGTFSPSGTPGNLSSFGNGNVSGTVQIQKFAVQNGQLVAIGSLLATLTNTAGQVTNLVTAVVAPVTSSSGSCQVVSLTLAPPAIDQLGLSVSLNPINVNISSSGGLLGGLLCNVSGLLTSNGSLNTVAALLNQIIGSTGLLGGLGL